VLKIANFLPAAITIVASIIAAAWCLTHGSTISASTAAEKGKPSVWGASLSLFGALLIFYGFLAGLMFTMETVNPIIILFVGIISMLAIVLMTSVAKSRGDEKSISGALDNMGSWGAVTAIIILGSILFILIGGGGEGDMIPDAAWGLLMGALTMIGSGFAAALCIMTAVKAGAEMLVEKPELSIWSLLFVALGEGLAIYGLIVAILLIG
jgi:V/A-type H+-transporting ATPase subunit K